jgi:hypothetical protein
VNHVRHITASVGTGTANPPTPAKADPERSVPAKAAKEPTIEERIGEAAASAAVAIAMGMADFAEAGAMSLDTRLLGGRTLGAVTELALAHNGFDFDLVARREGHRVLELRYGPMLREHLGAAKTDAAFVDLLDHVLAIAGQVVADERSLH